MTCSKSIIYRIGNMTYNDVLNHLLDTKGEFENQDDGFIRQYANKLSKNAYFVLATDVWQNIVGLIAFYANMPATAFITHVWVDEKQRGKGICTEMLMLLNQYCKENGYKTINLEVRNDNESAKAAYGKSGYIVVDITSSKSLMEKRIV